MRRKRVNMEMELFKRLGLVALNLVVIVTCVVGIYQMFQGDYALAASLYGVAALVKLDLLGAKLSGIFERRLSGEFELDPDFHDDECNHDAPLLSVRNGTGTCASCGAVQCCVGCRSADGECYCE